MTRINHLFITAAVVFTLAGCDRADFLAPVSDDESIPILIDGSINQIHTKATNQGFSDKDIIGLYAVNYSESNTVPGTLLNSGNQVDNRKYEYDELNHSWTSIGDAYYKDINTNVDLYLYYPYMSNITNVQKHPFSVALDQRTTDKTNGVSAFEASDLLWGKATGVQPTQSSVPVSLSHILSCVNLQLIQGSGFQEGEFEHLDKIAIISNTVTSATVNLSNGVVSKDDASSSAIVMAPQGGNVYKAIVVPQKISGVNGVFVLTVDGYTYHVPIDGNIDFVAGKQNTFKVKVSKKSPSGDYEFSIDSITVDEWEEDENSHGGTARQYYCVHVDKAGTLEALIKAAGKNPAKIKNLKLSGELNQDDFYFMRDKMEILTALNMKEVSKLMPCYCSYDTWHREKEGWYDSAIPERAFQNKESLAYVTLPDCVENILNYAFSGASLIGALNIPTGTKTILWNAFNSTYITSLSLPEGLVEIDDGAFGNTPLRGQLMLPESLKFIGSSSFYRCNFTGQLVLPSSIEKINDYAFQECGSFIGDLVLPDKLTEIPAGAFYCTHFSGRLILNTQRIIERYAFDNCGFTGKLIIPEGVVEIGDEAFSLNKFNEIIFPSTLFKIGQNAFRNNWAIVCAIEFNEGLSIISDYAFEGASMTGLKFPSTLQSIGTSAFKNCFNISSIQSDAVYPPSMGVAVFDGVNKNNFPLEVPREAIDSYIRADGWKEFNKITPYKGFALSRRLLRVLDNPTPREITIYAPEGEEWTLIEKPEWVNVSPSTGIGKTVVSISVGQLPPGTITRVETDYWPYYEDIEGRMSSLTFYLPSVDVSTQIKIEQYPYEYEDGDVIQLQTASKGRGVDIVFLGEGYDAKSLFDGLFLDNVQEGMDAFFDIEPYATYRDYFNVYAVIGESLDEGVLNVNNSKTYKFLNPNTGGTDAEACYQYVAKAIQQESRQRMSQVVLLLNDSAFSESTVWCYVEGGSISACSVSRESFPYDFRGLVQHSAGGKGFGHLASEQQDFKRYISDLEKETISEYHRLGFYRNLDVSGDYHETPWSHLIFHPDYSDYVDMYEGGVGVTRGVFRSEASSCMSSYIPYFNAISRQIIVEEIMKRAGEEFTLDKFYANDKRTYGGSTKSTCYEQWGQGHYYPRRHTPPVIHF